MDERVGSVLLLAAVTRELGPTARRLGLAWEDGEARGRVGEVSVRGVVSGVGAAGLLRCVEAALERERPGLVVHLGFAAGLDPALRAGEVVRPAEVVNAVGQRVALAMGEPGRVLLTSEALASSVKEKRAIRAAHGAAALDMETYPVAARLREAGVAVAAVRAISDAAEVSLPMEAARWVTPEGRPDVMPVARWVAGRPWRLLGLLRLARATRVGGERMAEVVERVVREVQSPRFKVQG